MGLEAEEDHFHEIEYFLPRLVNQTLFERLSPYRQVERHSLWVRTARLKWPSSGIFVLSFPWAAQAWAVGSTCYFYEVVWFVCSIISLQFLYRALTNCAQPGSASG